MIKIVDGTDSHVIQKVTHIKKGRIVATAYQTVERGLNGTLINVAERIDRFTSLAEARESIGKVL